jgi:hypothetical protein
MLIKIIYYLDHFFRNYYQKNIINKFNLINFHIMATNIEFVSMIDFLKSRHSIFNNN